MDIDTLILSGGGPSGIAYIGIFKALLDKQIIQENLKGIQEIITTSVGILISIALLLRYNIGILEEILLNFDFSQMINIEDISINDLLFELGLFDTSYIGDIVRSLIKNKYDTQDITLQDFYDRTQIKLTVKVHNCTDKVVEYISYENHPSLSLITLAQMTTAVPIFFKPIKYQEKYYCDGGIRGSFPIDRCHSPNYLGISVIAGIGDIVVKEGSLLEAIPLLPHIMKLFSDSSLIIEGPRVINIDVGLGLNFDISIDKKKNIIQDAYNHTIEFILKSIEL